MERERVVNRTQGACAWVQCVWDRAGQEMCG